jgi:hypothetical protein
MDTLMDKTDLRHRMRTLRAEAAARDPDGGDRFGRFGGGIRVLIVAPKGR